MARAVPATPPRWPGTPPVPREHGAWVMLLAPLLAGLAAAAPVDPLAAAALVVAACAAFLAQNAAALLLRPRATPSLWAWLAAFVAVLALAGVPLLLGPGRWALLALAAPGAALFALHARLQAGAVRDRLDRTGWGQVLTAGVLTLGGPAAFAIARGGLGWEAAALWAAFFVAFVSGIAHVNMRLAAVKVRTAFDGPTRWRLARGVVGYHVLLATAALAAAAWHPAGALLAIGLAPFVGRGLLAAWRLAPGVPSFKRIGLAEAALTIWLAGWAVAALGAAG